MDCRKCEIYLCANSAAGQKTSTTTKRVTFHCFPKKHDLRQRWIKAAQIDTKYRKLPRRSFLCSQHFKLSDYVEGDRKKRLKSHAVPTIFPWSGQKITLKASFSAGKAPNTALTCPSSSSAFHLTAADQTYDLDFSPTFKPVPDIKTYSKALLPTQFVEEYTTFNIDIGEETKDPLNTEEPAESIEDSNSYKLHLSSHLELPNDNLTVSEVEISSSSDNIHINIPRSNSALLVNRQTQTDNISDTVTQTLPYSIYKHKGNDKFIHFFTGLETFDKFLLVFQSLGNSSDLNYFYEKPPRKLDALEQFFITLTILRRHREFEDIAMTYMISIKQVTNIFITWIRFMSLQWQNLDLWVDRETVQTYMPLDFYDKYPMTRVVIDATEFPIKKPGLPFAQQATFSSYKNRNTVKVLIGIAPSGLITYVSPSYAGSATDRNIIERSSILSKFDYQDEIMVDKGLNIQDIMLPYGVKVNMPTFFKKGNQISSDTLIHDRKIASKRVHVERIIGMMKTYKILTQPMNHTETMLSSDIIFICAMLINFRSSIINMNA